MKVQFQELLNETLEVASTRIEQHNFTLQKSSTVLEVSFGVCVPSLLLYCFSNRLSVKPSVADQAVLTTGRHHKLNTHYFNLMLIMC